MKSFITIFLISISCFAGAQSKYNFSRIFLDKGLSDPRVNNITQDKFGYMWFGTPNGLNRYDGYSIKTFYSKSGKNDLPSGNITSLYSSKSGDLWVGTAAGLVKYDFASENFLTPDSTLPLAKEIGKARVNAITEDSTGNIYFGTIKGIVRYIIRTKKWEDLNATGTGNHLRQVRHLKFFSKDLLLVTTHGNIPFFMYDLKTHKTDSIALGLPGGKNPNMYGIEKINDSEVLGGLLSFGIVKINVVNKTFKTVPGVLGRNEDILYNTVYDILKDSRGRVWLASFYFRLAEYLPAKDTVITFDNIDPHNPYGFESKNAIAIFEDRQKNIWVSTAGKGVYYFYPEADAVQFHGGNDHIKNALQRGSVFDLTVLDSNTIFVGTDKGMSFLDLKTGTYLNYTGKSKYGINGPMEYAAVALQDRNKKIVWIGTNRLGLVKYDRERKTFQNYSRVTKPYPLDDDGISELLQLPDGNIFLIGWGNPGIFNPASNQYFSVRNDSLNEVFKLKRVSSICKDASGNILLATLNGNLYRYDTKTKVVRDQTNLLATYKSLNTIYEVIAEGARTFLVTNVGVVWLDAPGGSKLYKLTSDLNIEQEYRAILPVGNSLWICSNRKIGTLDLKTGSIYLLGEKEGLQNVQLYPKSLALSPGGSVLIGSSAGYYQIFPERLKTAGNPLAPFLTSFRVNDKPLFASQAISGLEEVKLKYDENFFAFDLSNFYYAGASDVEYAYKLEGFDKDWQYIGKNRTGSYTNVPGGDYTLRLKAKNAEGKWNENGQVVKIHIGVFFAKTWWFKTLMALIFLSLLYAFYRYRISEVNKQARMRSDYEIKLNELENSALRTQMNPHFIFNSLNTINSFISLNETAQAHKYIASFSRLIRFILDHSRQRKILLENELEVLKLYIEIEQVRFSNKFEYEIIVDDSIDTSTVEMPPLVIQPFVENAILHGLLPAEKSGLLTVRIKHINDMLLCIVEDDGIGRKKSEALRNQNFSLHKSHGIDITLKRISLFNTEHGKEGEVKFIDLEQGTRVEIPLAWEESF